MGNLNLWVLNASVEKNVTDLVFQEKVKITYIPLDSALGFGVADVFQWAVNWSYAL